MPELDKGSTDVSRYIFLVDSAAGTPETGYVVTDLDMQYTRVGSAPNAKADCTDLGATDAAHSDTGAYQVDATSSPGLYRIDWPDAAFAVGAESVILSITGTGLQPAFEEIDLKNPSESASSAISTPPKASPDGFTITSGENEANTEDSAFTLDGTTHDIEAVTDGTEKIEVYYEFTVGGHGIATSVEAHQRLKKGGGAGKNLSVWAYNWVTPGWDRIGTIDSSGAVEESNYTLLFAHTGTGANLGLVRIRFLTGSVALSGTTELKTDQILVKYVIASRTVGYVDGAVWIDTVGGVAGTESFVNGTADNPVDTLADAITVATAMGLKTFHVMPGSTITFAETHNDEEWLGKNWTLALASQDIAGVYVEGAAVSGVASGTGTTQTYNSCEMGATSHIKGTHLDNCHITGTQTVVEAGDFFLTNCSSGIAGTSTWVWDFGAVANTNLNMRSYSGGVQLENMGDSGTDTASIEGFGQVIEGTCTGGTVAIRGCFTVSGITNLTLSDDARYDVDQILNNSTRVFNGTSTASSTTTKVFVQAGDPPTGGSDDDYNDTIICVYDGTDKSTARFNMRVIDDYDDSDPSFTVSPALGFTPGSGDLVEVFRADTGALTLLNTLAAGFSGTSPGRLIDHLRTLASKNAVTPASLGTYDPATDSQEKISENLALALGAGFSTSTDSLKAIRDVIDALLAPSVVSSSALSGSGFLSDCVSLIRKAVDEPSSTPKYTDGDIVELLQAGIDQVIADVHVNTDHPIMVRHSITLVDGVQDYVLPPQVGELIRIAKINTTTQLPEYEVWPGSYHDPGGHGWKIEGNILRILRDWDSTDALELLYIPNSEPLLHKGTSEAEAATTITLMATPTDGTLGKRPNEYVGMVVRILSSDQNIQEERVITAYDVTTRVATINKAWDTTPTGTVVYEIVPTFGRMFKHVVSLRAAIDLLSQEGNSDRMATLERNYFQKMSTLRRQINKKEGRFPHHFDGDTWDNTNRGGIWS